MTNEKILAEVSDIQDALDAQNGVAYLPCKSGYRRYPGGAAFELFKLQQFRDEFNHVQAHRKWSEDHCRRLETKWDSVAASLKRIADHVAPVKDVDPEKSTRKALDI